MSFCSPKFRLCAVILVILTLTHLGIVSVYFSKIGKFRFMNFTKVSGNGNESETSTPVTQNAITESTLKHGLNSLDLLKATFVPSNKTLRDNSSSLSPEQESIIEEQRLLIQGEMNNYNFRGRTLDSLLFEAGGTPLRTVLFTTWRSGSNFLGSILEQNAGTFYYTEPLAHHVWTQFRNGTDAEAQTALRELKDLLTCNYSNHSSLGDYIHFATKEAPWTFDANPRMGQHCQKSARMRVCANPTFLTRMCKLFPVQAAKVIRMRMRLARWLLEDPRWNARVIYLVRDPRGSLQSRLLTPEVKFCGDESVCSPKVLCSDLQDDYETAKEYAKNFPDKFMVVRYEDLALSPMDTVKTIFNFSQMDFNYKMEKFVEEHTKQPERGSFSIFRDSKDIVFKWREKLNWSQVKNIQSHCFKTLTNWGYKLAAPSDNLHSFYPLGPFNLLENDSS